MEWTDDGIILGLRRLGEGHAVAELMTAEHGRHMGLVYGCLLYTSPSPRD